MKRRSPTLVPPVPKLGRRGSRRHKVYWKLCQLFPNCPTCGLWEDCKHTEVLIGPQAVKEIYEWMATRKACRQLDAPEDLNELVAKIVQSYEAGEGRYKVL